MKCVLLNNSIINWFLALHKLYKARNKVFDFFNVQRIKFDRAKVERDDGLRKFLRQANEEQNFDWLIPYLKDINLDAVENANEYWGTFEATYFNF